MKKTAVQWLRKELEYLREYEEFYTKRYMEVDALFREALKMEEDENKRSWIEGCKSGFDSASKRTKYPSGCAG
jgi:hypothetical protein